MTEKQRLAYDPVALLRKMERATTLDALAFAGEEAKTAAEEDKPLLRQVYAVRLREITATLAKVPEGWKDHV